MSWIPLAAALLLAGGCDHPDEPEVSERAPARSVQKTLGEDTLRLTATADRLTLTRTDAAGSPVAPAGEVGVVLTSTAGDTQHIVLRPDGGGWSGSASAAGASGYVAQVRLGEETVRFAWDGTPVMSSPPEAHDHAH